MKLFALLYCLTITFYVNAQDSFTVHGKIQRLSNCNSVIISSSYGEFSGQIKEDGSFLITGKGVKPGEALIHTNSSGSDAFWLEPGKYEVECREIKMDGISGTLFRTPFLKGPQDAEIYHGFKQPFYYLNASTAEERKSIRSSFAVKYIDSIFEAHPSSKVLPDMLRFARPLLDDQAVSIYFSLLSDEQKAQPGAEQLSNYFKRKEKIESEKIFENFSLPNEKAQLFELNSVKGKKLILIDYWSSDCAPCRHKHKRLVEIYKKYSGRGLEIVSISLDKKRNDWLDAIEKDKMTWINVSDLKGWETSIAKRYFISSIPFAIFLDNNRNILTTEPTLTDGEIEKYLNN